jgi:polyhydroxyalkanoate synthesis regulator phasin
MTVNAGDEELENYGEESSEQREARFDRVIAEACEQLEKVVQRRGVSQLNEMVERLVLLERELDRFLEERVTRSRRGGR